MKGLYKGTGQTRWTVRWKPALNAAGPDCDQGGITDPTAGLLWEGPECRKEYDPGDYASGVRRYLLTRGPDGDGWTHITMAAEAASTLVGLPVPAGTVRKWMDRGNVASVCRWTCDEPPDGTMVPHTRGMRLVF